MFMTGRPEVIICRESEARTQNLKFLSESSCSVKVSGTGFMIKPCQANQILSFPNIKLSYSFTDVSGTAMKVADIL